MKISQETLTGDEESLDRRRHHALLEWKAVNVSEDKKGFLARASVDDLDAVLHDMAQ